MTIGRIGGSGIFAGMPLNTSDNGDPREWIAFWHTDEEKMDRIVEALQYEAEGEEAIGEMETLADFMFAVQNPPGASERALRIATEARVIEVESKLCALACKECHPYGRGSVNNWWMRYKIGVYGLERVKAALERVNKHLTDPVTLAEFNVSEK